MASQPSQPTPVQARGARHQDLPRFTGWLRPMVDAVARLDWSVHRKLMVGFLSGAVLLVAMGALSLVVIARMDDRVDDLTRHQEKADIAQQMLYQVTAQSHYRAMTFLLTKDDPAGAAKNVRKLAVAKSTFADLLNRLKDVVDPDDADTISKLEESNREFELASDRVSELYERGSPRGLRAAQQLHVSSEHEISHDLENLLNPFIVTAHREVASAEEQFRDSRTLLTALVVAFSAASVLGAMWLGFVLSWAFILPVHKVEKALGELSAGEFAKQVEVPNRDEFGVLAKDLNATSARLRMLFDDQRMLAEKLRTTNSSLIEVSEAKSRFLANVSHELRTPLNAVLGFTDALLAGVDGPLNDEQTTSLGWVQRGGRDLLDLIDEILDLSKIEAGKLTIRPETFDPRELVEVVVAQHRSLAAQNGVRLSWQDDGAPAQVYQDRRRVRQIMINLLGNALKFTAEGEVEVRVGGDDGTLRLTVHDTGPGVPADQHEDIFREFHRGGGPEPGTGLGLSISRRLARALGGELTLQSEPGRGCTFELRVPRHNGQPPPATTPQPAGHGDAEADTARAGTSALLRSEAAPSPSGRSPVGRQR
jgi:signal transduction histidine kinase